jgi:uncharacterized membrane protein
MTYGGSYGWIVLAVIAAAGVLVRRFFVLSHKGRYVVGLPVAAAVLLAAVAFAIAPRELPRTVVLVVVHATYSDIAPIVAKRCAVCHAAHPTEPGFTAAPLGVLLDTPQGVRANAARIDAQAVASHAMPLGNVTHMTDAERAQLGDWIHSGAKI